jgi:DNA (cytosine-5)-methyltransferase 1
MVYCERAKIKVCSFFSGGGLLDLAFKDDFEIIWANELHEQPAISYMHNIGKHIKVGDILQYPNHQIPYGDVYIGGPPCVDYSSDGKNRGEEGLTGRLVWKYQSIIAQNRPMAFLLENVANLARQHKNTLYRLVTSFSDLGYNVGYRILNAADFGVAQSRERVFIVGIRSDLGFYYEFPSPPMISRTVRDAIGDLPEATTVTKYIYEEPLVANHTTNWESPSPERLYDVIQNPRNQRRGMRRLEWDKVSPTLTAHIAKDGREFLHPEADRRLTVREALRIMSVPDWYVIPGSVKLSHQYRLTGNGVPYLLGKALARELKGQLSECLMTNDGYYRQL